MSWSTVFGSGFATAVIWGAVFLVRALMGRPLIQANAADRLSDSALDLVRQARDDAKAARQDADDARRDAAEARREAADARREAADVAREFRRLAAAVMSPHATVENLRQMVAEGPGNGVAGRAPAPR